MSERATKEAKRVAGAASMLRLQAPNDLHRLVPHRIRFAAIGARNALNSYG